MRRTMMKKIVIFLLAIVLIGSNLNPVYVKANEVTELSKTKVTLEQGKTKTISLLNNDKKVKWTTSNNKVVKILSSSKDKVKIKAVKKGTAYVKAKVGTKTYKCKVIVIKGKQLTEEQAFNKLEQWLKNQNVSWSGKCIMCEGKNGDDYLFRLYEDMGSHIVTINWYYVNCKTGKVTAEF